MLRKLCGAMKCPSYPYSVYGQKIQNLEYRSNFERVFFLDSLHVFFEVIMPNDIFLKVRFPHRACRICDIVMSPDPKDSKAGHVKALYPVLTYWLSIPTNTAW